MIRVFQFQKNVIGNDCYNGIHTGEQQRYYKNNQYFQSIISNTITDAEEHFSGNSLNMHRTFMFATSE